MIYRHLLTRQFWFDVIEEAREWILQLCDDDAQAVQPTDWNAFVQLSSRSASDVKELFYPDAPQEADLEAAARPYRRPGFLVALDDAAYYSAYEAVLEFPDRRFPDIQALLRTGRRDGKAVSQLMYHVVRWVNPSPATVGDRQNNKPPLWHDLKWPFKVDSSTPAGTEGQAQQLQRRIFDIVRDRITELSDLSKLPGTDGESYLERFESPIWKDILLSVHSIVGPCFQGVMAKFNQQDPVTLASRQESTLVSAMSKAICQVPGIAQNPALRSKQALGVLMSKLSPVILTWASEQCNESLRAQHQGNVPLWPPSVLDSVTAELGKLNALLPQPNPVQRTLLWTKPAATRQSSSPNMSDHWTSSPPTLDPLRQAEKLQVQSPVISELDTVPEVPDDVELPPLAGFKTIDVEIDEAELQRRMRKQRRPSCRAPQIGKGALHHENRPLLPPKATLTIPANKTMPGIPEAASKLTVPRPSSRTKTKRSWENRPAAHPFSSDRSLPSRQPKT